MPKVHETLFHIALYSSYVLYIVAYAGIRFYNPTYLDMLHTFIKYFIIFFLMIRFNPYTKSSAFTSFDREVVFESSIFLFTSSALNSVTSGMAAKALKSAGLA